MNSNLKARLDIVLDHLEDSNLRSGMATVQELMDAYIESEQENFRLRSKLGIDLDNIKKANNKLIDSTKAFAELLEKCEPIIDEDNGSDPEPFV